MSPAKRERMLDALRRRNPEALDLAARRSKAVKLVKLALPVTAAVLLTALAAAPVLRAGPDANRVSYHMQANETGGTKSHMQGAQYVGVDQKGQPYTVTADNADQQSSGDIALTKPEGDLTLKSGAWLVLKSNAGLYHQSNGKLGLDGHVMLYRNDGTTMNVAHAEIDMHGGNAQSSDPVDVEGPFGTLNAAQGFVLTNRGEDIKFLGPSAMTLIQAQ